MFPRRSLARRSCTVGRDRRGEKINQEEPTQKSKEPEAVGTISSFFNPLFASIHLKILFCRQAILDS